jgi:hypothetical protein
MKSKFLHVLAAVEARETHLRQTDGKDLWAIGAALIKDMKDLTGADKFGAIEKAMKECSKLLLTKGFDYSTITLRNIWETAIAFPVARRHAEVSFFAHTEAGNPDILDWIVKQVGDGVSGRDVRDWVKRWHSLHAIKRQGKKAAAVKKKATARTDKEREAAQREIDENTDAPTPKELPVPDRESQHQLHVLAEVLDIDGDARSITKTLRANLARLHKLDEINAEFVEALVEHHDAVIEAAKQIVNFVSNAKRNGLVIIEGGKKSA